MNIRMALSVRWCSFKGGTFSFAWKHVFVCPKWLTNQKLTSTCHILSLQLPSEKSFQISFKFRGHCDITDPDQNWNIQLYPTSHKAAFRWWNELGVRMGLKWVVKCCNTNFKRGTPYRRGSWNGESLPLKPAGSRHWKKKVFTKVKNWVVKPLMNSNTWHIISHLIIYLKKKRVKKKGQPKHWCGVFSGS